MNPELETAVARAVYEDANTFPGPGGWTTSEATYVELGDVSSVEFWRTERDGSRTWVDDTSSWEAFRELRAAMAGPHGAWLSATLTLHADGQYAFSYNYDERPRWADGMEVEPEGFLADQQRFPRPWEEIPDWHPVKERYTEQSWAAETARF